jgi:hypothetical protein
MNVRATAESGDCEAPERNLGSLWRVRLASFRRVVRWVKVGRVLRVLPGREWFRVGVWARGRIGVSAERARCVTSV